jgi:hypothetical protein
MTLNAPEQTRWRDAFTAIVPRWLRRTYAARYLGAIAYQLDAAWEAGVAGLKLRFPGLYSEETLSRIGRERGIIRGPSENVDGYAARLSDWREAHRRAGGWVAQLTQLHAHFTGATWESLPWRPVIDAVHNGGTSSSVVQVLRCGESGAISAFTRAWDWDSHSPGGADALYHSRFWLILYMPDGIPPDTSGLTFGAGKHWGEGNWGDGHRWGTAASTSEVATLRTIAAAWTAPHARLDWIIVVYSASTWEDFTPDGNWDRYQYRNPNVSYFQGTT